MNKVGHVESVPAPAAYRAVGRPAGVFTQQVDYPVAARLCVAANRLGLRPTVLTLGNLVLGLGASATVAGLADLIARDQRWAVVVGLVSWLVWQFAYCLDCADGQLARVTSTSSAAGGRLDVLCDIAVQVAVVGAVSAVTAATHPRLPSWLVAAFAGSWMVNLATSVMAKEGTNVSLVSSGSAVVRAVKLVRDYGFMLTVISAVIAVHPPWMLWVMAFFTVVNGAFLFAVIVQSARSSLRGTSEA